MSELVATWYNGLVPPLDEIEGKRGGWTSSALSHTRKPKVGKVTETVGQMTKAEFERMINSVVEAAVEQKLLEILGDPDERSQIREDIRNRLLRQRQAVAAGERGLLLEDAIGQLGLE